MKNTHFLLSLLLLGSASASVLDAPSFAVQPGRIEGNAGLIGAADQETVLRALVNDFSTELKAIRPSAGLTTAAPSENDVAVTPILIAPDALLPWSKVSAALEFRHPDGRTERFVRSYGLLEVYNHRDKAANYLFAGLLDEMNKIQPSP